jgi:hypothetical protein
MPFLFMDFPPNAMGVTQKGRGVLTAPGTPPHVLAFSERAYIRLRKQKVLTRAGDTGSQNRCMNKWERSIGPGED